MDDIRANAIEAATECLRKTGSMASAIDAYERAMRQPMDTVPLEVPIFLASADGSSVNLIVFHELPDGDFSNMRWRPILAGPDTDS